MQRRELGFGEAFVNTGNLLKPFDTLTAFKGCKINFFGGGNNKTFVVFEDPQKTQKVVPLHPAEIDQYDYTVSENQGTENYTLSGTEPVNDKVDIGRIEQLKSDQNFNLFLNDRGEVYVTGQGIYGVLGLGNRRLALEPMKVFSSKTGIKSIACGSGHCMLLTNDRSLYVWGRNFEGQLGLPYIQISCKPTFNPFFNYTRPKTDPEAQKKLCIDEIYLAGSHSFAVLSDRSLYAWGENLYGQLGLPRQSKYVNPTIVPLLFGVKTISAAKTHTFIISETGQLYTTGLNSYGQLGLGTMPKKDTFSHVFEDFHNYPLPEFQSIQTNYNSGLAVTTSEQLYVWGRSVLLEEKQVQPVNVEIQKDIAALDHVFLTNLNCLVFSKLKAYDILPRVSPSSGNTKCAIRGYGLTDFGGRQRVRFRLSFKNKESNYKGFEDEQLARFKEVKNLYYDTAMVYNTSKGVFEFSTPVFFTEHYLGDAFAEIDVSLDGHEWLETSLSIVIYNCNTRIVDISPRYVHVDDKQQLRLHLTNLIEFPDPFVKDIKVTLLGKNMMKKRTSRFGDEPETAPDANKLPKLYTVDGSIVEGQVVCDLPSITEFNKNGHSSSLISCYIGVTLNGQQLFEDCVEFTFYSIQEAVITPLCVRFEGGIRHELEFDGLFNSPHANLKLVYQDQVSTVQPKFVIESRKYKFHSPMMNQPVVVKPVENENPSKDTDELLELIEVDVRMTLCGNYYQSIGKLIYHQPRLERLLSQLEKEKQETDIDYRARMLSVVDPFAIDAEIAEKEADKKRKEIEKKVSTLEMVLKVGVVKARDFILVKGHNFVIEQVVDVKLTWSQDLLVINGVVKSAELIVFEVPDLRADQTSVVEINIEVSFNAKQYTSNGLILDALLLRKDIADELQDKETTEFMKKYKKPKKVNNS